MLTETSSEHVLRRQWNEEIYQTQLQEKAESRWYPAKADARSEEVMGKPRTGAQKASPGRGSGQ